MIINPVDVHCHFFNVKFAFRELLEIGWRRAIGNYPYQRDDMPLSKERSVSEPDLDSLLKYVARLLATALQSAEDNYKLEQKCYKKGLWNYAAPLITVPLMMDIFFMLDDGSSLKNRTMPAGLPEDEEKRVFGTTLIPQESLDSFTRLAMKLKADVIQTFEKERIQRGLTGAPKRERLDLVWKELDDVISEFQHPEMEEKQDVCRTIEGGVQMTRGFRKHLLELQELKNKNHKTVLPFLAVDPRRTGIEKLVKELILPGIFKGIKLYPPLGYLPTHPDLYPIYQLCIENDIPVTTHTSPGGMKNMCKQLQTKSRKQDGTIDIITTSADNPVELFATPNNWRAILENKKYSNLRLNFAHFGGSEAIQKYANFLIKGKKSALISANWSYQIIQLMIEFENVYADFSYCPEKQTIENINILIEHHPILKTRLMFGTDFVMVMKEASMGGLENYFRNCAGMGSAIHADNAMKFLMQNAS